MSDRLLAQAETFPTPMASPMESPMEAPCDTKACNEKGFCYCKFAHERRSGFDALETSKNVHSSRANQQLSTTASTSTERILKGKEILIDAEVSHSKDFRHNKNGRQSKVLQHSGVRPGSDPYDQYDSLDSGEDIVVFKPRVYKSKPEYELSEKQLKPNDFFGKKHLDDSDSSLESKDGSKGKFSAKEAAEIDLEISKAFNSIKGGTFIDPQTPDENEYRVKKNLLAAWREIRDLEAELDKSKKERIRLEEHLRRMSKKEHVDRKPDLVESERSKRRDGLLRELGKQKEAIKMQHDEMKRLDIAGQKAVIFEAASSREHTKMDDPVTQILDFMRKKEAEVDCLTADLLDLMIKKDVNHGMKMIAWILHLQGEASSQSEEKPDTALLRQALAKMELSDLLNRRYSEIYQKLSEDFERHDKEIMDFFFNENNPNYPPELTDSAIGRLSNLLQHRHNKATKALAMLFRHKKAEINAFHKRLTEDAADLHSAGRDEGRDFSSESEVTDPFPGFNPRGFGNTNCGPDSKFPGQQDGPFDAPSASLVSRFTRKLYKWLS